MKERNLEEQDRSSELKIFGKEAESPAFDFVKQESFAYFTC